MFILASSNYKVLSRWKDAIPAETNSISTRDLKGVYKYVNNYPYAMIILHYSLYGLNGLASIKTLYRNYSESKILVLEDVPSEMHGVELIKSGILGYGNTYLDPSVLNEAIKVISMGEIWISKRFVQWLAYNCHNFCSETFSQESDSPFNTLTPGEVKILNHLLDGDSNKVIAKKLNISERTVKAHLTSIFRKTGIKDRLHLALRASGRVAS